jgi:ABC-type cobalamin/Fe3+-siderophores transport system ATPase subunit
LAEQDTNMALKYADYGYFIGSGRIVMDGAASDLRNNEDVKEFYLGMSGAGASSSRMSRATSGASAGWPEILPIIHTNPIPP